jgi:uncharacterized protein (DUF2235 family)
MTSLVICCDGTWNDADQENDKGEPCVTNVLKLACRVAKRNADNDLQVVYYDQGVGTGNALDRATGGAFGDGLEANIHDAYRFLVANYEPNDRIYLFGFSRGAFTARSIAGMIRRCGILRRDKVREYKRAKETYRKARDAQDPIAEHFRSECAIEPDTPIHCIGVWDTVGALGIPLRGFRALTHADYQFHDTTLSKRAKFAFHALAIDEHRAPFEPTLWDSVPVDGQLVKQVWFAGAHSNVGGGYSDHGLSDLALDWMMNEVSAPGPGLLLDVAVKLALPTNPNFSEKPTNSKTGLYRVTPSLNRPIGASPSGTEYLHRSVIAKWKGDGEYRPPSLVPHTARLQKLAAGPLAEEIYPVA